MHAHSIVLRYPADWLVAVHPAHEAARRDTESWLRALGVLEGEGAARTFAAMNVGWYGGAPFPDAPFERLTTITRFFTLWIFHDEVLEGLGASAPRVLGAAVRGEPAAAEESGYLRGWRELGARFRAAMSDRWLSRFSERFVTWLGSLDAEARLAAEAQRSGRPPSFEAYMAVRTINIGVLPTTCWIEYAQGRELSPVISADPDLARAERLASRVITFQNDVAGLDKDARRGWPNAVLSLAADERAPLRAALDTAIRLHDIDVGDLAATCDRLARRHGEPARAWTSGLARLVAGLGRWHTATPRYSVTLPGGEAVRVTLGAGCGGAGAVADARSCHR
jgi:hypothetical protein